MYFATTAGEQNQTVRIGRSDDDEGERVESDFFVVQTGTTGRVGTFHVILQSKHQFDDSQYDSPCNQSDTRE